MEELWNSYWSTGCAGPKEAKKMAKCLNFWLEDGGESWENYRALGGDAPMHWTGKGGGFVRICEGESGNAVIWWTRRLEEV